MSTSRRFHSLASLCYFGSAMFLSTGMLALHGASADGCRAAFARRHMYVAFHEPVSPSKRYAGRGLRLSVLQWV